MVSCDSLGQTLARESQQPLWVMTFKVTFEVKRRGSLWSLKLPSDSKNNGLMRFLGSNSSVSKPTAIVGHDLQGQIRGQMAGITLEPKVTVRFEK